MEVSETVINDLYAQIAVLRRQVERLQNNPVLTLPIYDSANFPQDAIEGQVVIATT